MTDCSRDAMKNIQAKSGALLVATLCCGLLAGGAVSAQTTTTTTTTTHPDGTTTTTVEETTTPQPEAPPPQSTAPNLIGPAGVTGTIRRSDRRQDRRAVVARQLQVGGVGLRRVTIGPAHRRAQVVRHQQRPHDRVGHAHVRLAGVVPLGVVGPVRIDDHDLRAAVRICPGTDSSRGPRRSRHAPARGLSRSEGPVRQAGLDRDDRGRRA